MSETKKVQLITDPKFENGFNLLDTKLHPDGNHKIGVMFCNGDYDSPSWNIAQWCSRENILGVEPTTKDNMICYENSCKLFGCYTDTDGSKTIRMQSDGTAEWLNPVRSTVDHPSWPHTLLETFTRDYLHRGCTGKMRTLNFSMDLKINYVNSLSMDSPDMTAQFNICLMFQNRTEGHKDYGRMFWFGIPCYDYRFPKKDFSGEIVPFLDRGTGCYIVGPNSPEIFTKYWNGNPYDNFGKWLHLDIDTIPYLTKALEAVQSKDDMTSTSLDDIYFVGFNVGFEIPGAYDVSADVKNISVITEYKEEKL